MNWFTVSDRLPLSHPADGVVSDRTVLAWDGRTVSEVLYRVCYDASQGGWFKVGVGRVPAPLAWMPMPGPPRA